MNEISALITETLQSPPCPFHHVRTQREVCNLEEGPPPHADTSSLDFQPPACEEEISNLYRLPSLWDFSYSSPSRLRQKCAVSVMSDSLQPHGLCNPMEPARLLCPWDSPGKNTAVYCHFLLQGIFPTQGSNQGLLHCRQILYCLSHWGSPKTELERGNSLQKRTAVGYSQLPSQQVGWCPA